MTWFDDAIGELNDVERAILLARADEIREEADRRVAEGTKPSEALIQIVKEILKREGYSLKLNSR